MFLILQKGKKVCCHHISSQLTLKIGVYQRTAIRVFMAQLYNDESLFFDNFSSTFCPPYTLNSVWIDCILTSQKLNTGSLNWVCQHILPLICGDVVTDWWISTPFLVFFFLPLFFPSLPSTLYLLVVSATLRTGFIPR